MTYTHHHTYRGSRARAVIAFLLLLAAISCSTASAEIMPDAASNAVGSTANLSWSHTVGSGVNRILIVGVSMRRNNRSVRNITYASLGLTRIGFQASPNDVSRTELWYLLAPPEGTAKVMVTLSGATAVIAGAASFFGVDQSEPMGAFTSTGGVGPTASLSLASAAYEIVVDVAAAPGTALSLDPGTGQTMYWNAHTGLKGSDTQGGCSGTVGAPHVTTSWTLGTPGDWAIGAVSLKPPPHPIVILTLAQNDNVPPPGATVVYTVNFTNAGNGEAGSAFIAVSAPASTALVANSVLLNGVSKTDAADTDEVTLSGSTITVNLGSMAAGENGTLSYRVVVQ